MKFSGKIITTCISVLMFIAGTPFMNGQDTNIVVPARYGNEEASGGSNMGFGTSPLRIVTIYSATLFSIPAGKTALIHGVAHRLDYQLGRTFSGVFPQVSVSLSTTPRSPQAISTVFQENVGTNSQMVFNGSLPVTATTNPPSLLNPFDVSITFSNDFAYDPAQGNLVMLKESAAGPQSLYLDIHNDTNTASVFGALSKTNGQNVGLTLVAQFSMTIIPEAPTATLVSPLGGSHHRVGTPVTLSANATAGRGRTVTRVDYLANGTNLLGSAFVEPYAAAWTNVPSGNWSVMARVTDSAGETATSHPAAIVVEPPPSVRWILPRTVYTNGSDISLIASLLYNQSNIARITFQTDTNLLATFQGTMTNGPYQMVWTNLPGGEFTLTATGYDAQQAVLSTDIVTIYVLPPAVMDQAQSYDNDWLPAAPPAQFAQTFTPSFHGELDHIDVFAFYLTQPVEITLVETAGGAPTASVLARSLLPSVRENGEWRSAFFSPIRPYLRAGTLYAFVITPAHPVSFFLPISEDYNRYPLGSLWIKTGAAPWQQSLYNDQPDSDLAFATYLRPSFRVTSLVKSNDLVTLQWDALPGLYAIENAPAPSPTNHWITLAENISATNSVQSFRTNATEGMKFFRVRRVN